MGNPQVAGVRSPHVTAVTGGPPSAVSWAEDADLPRRSWMDTPALNRRDLLKVSLFGAAALTIPWESRLFAKSASRIASSKLPKPYTVPFAVPPVLAPSIDPVTKRPYFRIEQKSFVGEILPGVKT